MIKGILVLIGVVILITFDTLHLMEKIKMTKFILIIITVIGLLIFAYFTRIDGYRERIEQFSSYLPIDKPIKFI